MSRVAEAALKESTGFRWFENLILFVILSVIVLRGTFIESPHVNQPQGQMLLTSELVSLIISTVLLGCLGVWFVVSVLSNRLHWFRTGFGFSVSLFLTAGIIAFFAASNKRAALSDLVIMITPVLSGLVLVQLLNSPDKIRLALLLVICVGVTATVQCYDQATASNEILVQEYEQSPQKQLETLNIEPDSLEHWLYEHRLYSKDIRGFLMTSNSAASYFLLAIFAAIGLVLGAFRNFKHPETRAGLVCYLLALGVLLAGLIMTGSKGGNGAFILGVFFLVVFCVMGKSLWKHRIFIGIVFLIILAGMTAAIVAYGVSYDRLPGGNSMLVRWQYWEGTVQMIKDHLLTGVGGANFSEFYTHYKVPAASETIRDPHNWLLSLVSQYGPLGLIAFLFAIIVPVLRALGRTFRCDEVPAADAGSKSVHTKFWVGLLCFVGAGWFFIRPLLVGANLLSQPVDVRAAAYLVLYLWPGAIFIGAFILLRFVSLGQARGNQRNDLLVISLVCGVIALLMHNLIDFALFEPGVWSVLWLFIPILAACCKGYSVQQKNMVHLTVVKRLTTLAAVVFVLVFYFAFILIPPFKANVNQKMLSRVLSVDELGVIFERAIEADKLSPDAAYQGAGVLTEYYKQSRMIGGTNVLQLALQYAQLAQMRNPASFKPWRLQSEINLLLADQADGAQKHFYLEDTYDDFKQAALRYPGSGKLHFAMGTIAEELGLLPEALQHYQTAVWIEDLYRDQFRVMYPDQKRVISRLGNLDYEIAKEKIEFILEQMEKEPEETIKKI